MIKFLPLDGSGSELLVVLPPHSIGVVAILGHRSPVIIMKGGHPEVEGDDPVALGVYSLPTLTIHIAPTLRGPQLISTIIHELAHALFHLTGWGHTAAGTEADVALMADLLFSTNIAASLSTAIERFDNATSESDPASAAC